MLYCRGIFDENILSGALSELQHVFRANLKVPPRFNFLAIQLCPIRRIQVDDIRSNINLRSMKGRVLDSFVHITKFVFDVDLTELDDSMLTRAGGMVNRYISHYPVPSHQIRRLSIQI